MKDSEKEKEINKKETSVREEILESQRWEKITLRVWRRRREMESKRSGAGVCFPSGWWWATAASINTCLHGSHISCFTPHPSAGPHRRRTPQWVVCVCTNVFLSVCVYESACMVCILTALVVKMYSHCLRTSFCYHQNYYCLCMEPRMHTNHTLKHTSRLKVKEDIFHIRLEGGKNQAYSHLILTYVV